MNESFASSLAVPVATSSEVLTRDSARRHPAFAGPGGRGLGAELAGISQAHRGRERPSAGGGQRSDAGSDHHHRLLICHCERPESKRVREELVEHPCVLIERSR